MQWHSTNNNFRTFAKIFAHFLELYLVTKSFLLLDMVPFPSQKAFYRSKISMLKGFYGKILGAHLTQPTYMLLSRNCNAGILLVI